MVIFIVIFYALLLAISAILFFVAQKLSKTAGLIVRTIAFALIALVALMLMGVIRIAG